MRRRAIPGRRPERRVARDQADPGSLPPRPIPVIPDQPAAGYKKLTADLVAKPPDKKTLVDQVQLAICYLRLGQRSDAVRRDAGANDYLNES